MDVEPDRRGEQGLALVSVLWVVAVLSLVTVLVLRTGHTAISAARSTEERAQAEALIEMAWAETLVGLTQTGRTFGAGSIVFERTWRDARGEIKVRVTNDRGRLDLNSQQSAELRTVVEKLVDEDGATALVDAIGDFADADNLVRANGAEARDYAVAGRSTRPHNRPFEDEDDLARVLGMDREIYECMIPLTTVHNQTDRIETQYSGTDVLEALSPPRDAGGDRNGSLPAVSGIATLSILGEPLRAVFQVRVGKTSRAREVVFRMTEDNQHPIWVLAVRDRPSGPARDSCKSQP